MENYLISFKHDGQRMYIAYNTGEVYATNDLADAFKFEFATQAGVIKRDLEKLYPNFKHLKVIRYSYAVERSKVNG